MTNQTFCVIFDLFGVIFSKGLESSIKHLEAVLDRTEAEITPVYRRWEEDFDLGRIDETQFWKHVNSELRTNIDPRILSNIVISGYKLNGDIVSLIQRFEKSHLLVVYSNYRREWFEKLDAIFRISRHFLHVFISSDTGLLKPDPNVFHFVSDNLEIPIPKLVLIDDLPANVERAREVGANGIVFKSVYQTEVAVQRLTEPEHLPYDEHYSGIILLSPQNALILQRRDDIASIANPGMLSVFGGRRLHTEDDKTCAIRELFEETGLVCSGNELEYFSELSCPVENEKWMHCAFFIVRNVDINRVQIKEGRYIEIWRASEVVKEPDLTPVTRTVLSKFAVSETT